MGLDAAEISELAALRPIQTAVSGPRATAEPRTDDDAPAAGTGCVTPKASGARSAAAGGADDDDDAAADTGCVTPKASGSMAMLPIAPLQQDDRADVGFATPLATGGVIGPRDGCAAAGDENSFTTPTTADSALLPATGHGVPTGAAEVGAGPDEEACSAPAAALLPGAARPGHRVRGRAAVPAARQEDAGTRPGVICAPRQLSETHTSLSLQQFSTPRR
ncbi:hypothetical protein VPH35_139968 [Triticum aestivum]